MRINITLLTLSSCLLAACGGSGNDTSSTSPSPVAPVIDEKPVVVEKKRDVKVEAQDSETINETNLYIVANTNDPSSVILASEYAKLRNIPETNIINVALPVKIELTLAEAAPLRQAIKDAVGAKGFALAWSMPYRVTPHQSITSHVTDGVVDPASMGDMCNFTAPTDYYDSGSKFGKTVATTLSNKKPSMLLASYSSIDGGNVINPVNIKDNPTALSNYLSGIRDTLNRGIQADYKQYTGTAYYLKTRDNLRSLRATEMQNTVNVIQPHLNAQFLTQDTLGGKKDILIYQTGLANLEPSENNTNEYLPGSIADTLTSYSGRLYDSNGQISNLAFLKAGATASYGTVREPCAISSKFSDSTVLATHYRSGDSIIEAYNKSVKWPTEGLFIGEPLARPFSKITGYVLNNELYLKNFGGYDGNYKIMYGNHIVSNGVYLKQGEEVKVGAVERGLMLEKSNTFKAIMQ